MKKKSKKSLIAAYTLVELMVTVAVVSIAGAGVYSILRTGMIMFAKNSAINFTHQQVRNGLMRLQEDLHQAISTPQLVSTSGTAITGNGPAPGVSFRKYAGGPFYIYVASGVSTIAANSSTISIVTGTQGIGKDYAPLPGQRLHIQVLPTSLLEVDVASVGSPTTQSVGTVYPLTLKSTLGTSIQVVNIANNNPINVACFLSTPVSYIVQPSTGGNYQLLYSYLNSSGSTQTTVRSHYVAGATPFSVPTINGNINPSFITITNFTGNDAYTGNLGFNSTTLSVTMQTPHWCQLTNSY